MNDTEKEFIELYRRRIDAENGTPQEYESIQPKEDTNAYTLILEESICSICNQASYDFHNKCHDPETGQFCETQGTVEKASHEEKIEAKRLHRRKIKHAPVPSQADVKTKRAAIEKAKREGKRAGGDSRPNAEGRRRLQKYLWEEFGGPKRGYVVDPATGVKMHYTNDPTENPNRYPEFTLGRIFTGPQGGGYNQANLLPELLRSNQKRGSKRVRPENAN